MRKVDEDEFDAVVASGKAVLVKFFTEWCGPCNLLKPIVENLSKEISDVVFIEVDVSEEYYLGARFKVTQVPTMILFKDGIEISRSSSLNKQVLIEWIDRELNQAAAS